MVQNFSSGKLWWISIQILVDKTLADWLLCTAFWKLKNMVYVFLICLVINVVGHRGVSMVCLTLLAV